MVRTSCGEPPARISPLTLLSAAEGVREGEGVLQGKYQEP